MNIQAVKPNFQGRDAVSDFIKLDDDQLRKLAYLKTQETFNEKKNRRVTNGLFYASPLAAGLGAAILGNGKTKIFSKELSGVAGRLGGGLAVAAGFAAVLATVDLVSLAAKKLIKKSDKTKKFVNEHPFTTLAGVIAGAFTAVVGMNRGLTALNRLKTPDFLKRATIKAARAINTNKYVISIKNGLKKLSDKTPFGLKEIGATALDYAPEALLFGGLFHSLASSSAKNREFAKNYKEIRNLQNEVTQQRMAELVEENESLQTNNEEEFAGIL